MRHPEVLLLPVLMFTDYFLTLLGAVQKRYQYDEHFRTEHYELNPSMRKDVAQRKWFNPKHIVLTLLATALLTFVTEQDVVPEPLAQGLLGCFLLFFAAVIGKHLTNLFTFRCLRRRPNEISGQVTLTHTLGLYLSLYQYVSTFVPLLLLALLAPGPFTVGGVIGVALVLATHWDWIRRHRKQCQSHREKDGMDGALRTDH